jgi:hypothetical protein
MLNVTQPKIRNPRRPTINNLNPQTIIIPIKILILLNKMTLHSKNNPTMRNSFTTIMHKTTPITSTSPNLTKISTPNHLNNQETKCFSQISRPPLTNNTLIKKIYLKKLTELNSDRTNNNPLLKICPPKSKD